MSEETFLEEAKDSLLRIQNFDAKTLVRKEELGAKFAFDRAVKPAERLVGLFRLLPTEHLQVFPEKQLNDIKQVSDSVFALFQNILNFDPTEAEASTRKDQIVEQLRKNYQNSFNTMFPFVSFSVARTVDFNELSSQGRAAVQSIKDKTEALLEDIDATSKTAEGVLQEVRDAAAEQGITQQAKYFANEANSHETEAGNWFYRAKWMAGVVVVYAVSTLFFPQTEIFTSDTIQGAIQITVSKILIFFVLAFLLFQCVRNYAAHKHNGVVNRHRQNALMTYKTLAEAGVSVEARDTVLQHAAAAVYAPNDSGYARNEERGYGGNPLIGVMPRPGVGGGTSSE